MNQPKFEDGPPVPLMVEGLIDAATLRQMFDDLASSATILAVREKGDPQVYAGAGGISLKDALDRLLRSAARAIQIRYHYNDFEWTDTVLALPSGFRVLRCRHE